MAQKSRRDMIAFCKQGTYTILVNRIVNSTEKIECELKDEGTKKNLGKKVSLVWGGLGDGATINTIPRNVGWEKASKIELILGPFAYEKFYEKGKVCARYSAGNIFVEKVNNLEDYL